MIAPLVFTHVFLLAWGDDPSVSRPITVELRNGARIEGTLVERDGGVTVLRVAGGEIRLAEKTILRVIERESTEAKGGPESAASAAGDARVKVDLPAPGPMSLELPAAWTETKIEGRDLALTDPTQSLFFGMSRVSDAHSIWNLTPGIKREYEKLYPSFALEREKFQVKGRVRAWEIEFRYRKDSKDFREVQLLLDFGETKRIFTFTAAAGRFDDLVFHFRGVTESFRFDSPSASPPPAKEETRDAPPAAGASGAGAPPAGPAEPPDGADDVPRIDLDKLLPVPRDP